VRSVPCGLCSRTRILWARRSFSCSSLETTCDRIQSPCRCVTRVRTFHSALSPTSTHLTRLPCSTARHAMTVTVVCESWCGCMRGNKATTHSHSHRVPPWRQHVDKSPVAHPPLTLASLRLNRAQLPCVAPPPPPRPPTPPPLVQLIRVMDKLWRSEGLDLRLTPYRCIATWPMGGILEIVRESMTTADIQKRYGGRFVGAFRDDTFQRWIREVRRLRVLCVSRRYVCRVLAQCVLLVPCHCSAVTRLRVARLSPIYVPCACSVCVAGALPL
jgi:hypothetical protein